MAIPSECKMPDLSGLDSPLITRLLAQLMVGEPGLSPKASLYRKNFVRLVDKALREYHEAMEVLLAEVAEQGRHFRSYAFTDHIETCINAVLRLYQLLERIKSENESPELPKELRRQVETKVKTIREFRGAIEHIDKLIQKDEIAVGKPVMATASENGDAILVANYEIEFEELAMVLRKMHEIALYLLTIKKANLTTSI